MSFPSPVMYIAVYENDDDDNDDNADEDDNENVGENSDESENENDLPAIWSKSAISDTEESSCKWKKQAKVLVFSLQVFLFSRRDLILSKLLDL